VTARSSGAGRGPTFEVRLPLLPAGVAVGAPAPRVSRRVAGEPVRVLIVEDNEDNRQSLVALLTQLGHVASAAADGPQALQRLAAAPHDLAIVDIGLPAMDGYEVARRIRRTIGARPYLVALTGYGQPEDRARARDAGFDEHVTKPVGLEILEKIISLAPRAR
jgi:CheY-like chemotaxis protein